MINPNHWFVRLIAIGISWLLLLVVLFLVALAAASCNPIKQTEKAIAKSEKRKSELAALCVEQFPVKPQFISGGVDTTGLLGIFNKVCPEWHNDYMPLPLHIDSIKPLFYVGDTGQGMKQTTASLIRHINIDSLIAAIKKTIKPDTVKLPDTASQIAYEGSLKANQQLQQNLSSTGSKAAVRLWMFIASVVLNVLLIVLLFKFKTNPLNKVI